MNKKWIIIISAGLLLALAGAFVLLNQQSDKKSSAHIDAIGAIPFDAIFVIQCNELSLIERITADSSGVWSNLVQGKPSLLRWLHRAATTYKSDEATAKVLHAKTSLSAHPLGKNDIALLCCISLPQEIGESDWLRFLELYEQPLGRQLYQDHRIASLRFEDGLIYFSYVKGVVLASTSEILLQTAIRHSTGDESLANDPQFTGALQTLGANVDVCLLVNHRKIARLLNMLGNKPGEDINNFLSHTANWTAVDGQINNNHIQLNGFMFPSFSNDNFLSVLLNQSGHNTEAWEVLPPVTAFFLSFTLNDPKRFLSDYIVYLEKQKALNKYKQEIATLDKQWSKNASELFLSIYPAELCVACVPSSKGYSWVSMIRTHNKDYALEQFKELSGHLQMTFIAQQERIAEKNIIIYNNPAKGWLTPLIGSIFNKVDDNYFLVSNDWIYFADSREVLKDLSLLSSKSSLKRELYETEAAQYLSGNNTLTLLFNASQNAENDMLDFLHPSLQNRVSKISRDYPRNIQSIQLRPSGDKFFINFFALFERSNKLNSDTITPEVAALTNIAKPQEERYRTTVINHYTKEKEFFVQYSDNSFGLLTQEGKVLWQKKLSSPITGAVLQIDYLNNKKLQYLFYSANKLYLYDRNGKTVKPFPLNRQKDPNLNSNTKVTVLKNGQLDIK